jgi:hypothetical protein
MYKRYVGFWAAILLALILGGLWSITSYSQKGAAPSPAVADGGAAGSEIVAGYKQWTRVNPVPAVMESQIAVQCAAPTLQQSQMQAGSPHAHKLITVYVNEIGRHAMMEEKLPHFTLGSVIVKEKLPAKDSSEPELLTVMMKREAGYDPDNGDWEYMALDGSGKTVQARGKLEKCQACHLMEKATDYVSRNYLPSEVRQKLK